MIRSLWRTYIIDEGSFDGIQVVSTDGNEVSSTTNVEVELILKIQEARDTMEKSQQSILVVSVVVEVDVSQDSTDDVGADSLLIDPRRGEIPWCWASQS